MSESEDLCKKNALRENKTKHKHYKKCCNHNKHNKHNSRPYIDHIKPTIGARSHVDLFIYGHGLSKTTSVNIGTISTEEFTIINDHEVQVYIHEIEIGDNVLITVGTHKYVSNGVFYTIVNPPIIINLDPLSGPIGSSVNITINGNYFATAKSIIINNCVFDILSSTMASVISDTVISFVLPSKFDDLSIAISIVTLGGTSNIVFYTGTPLPMI